MAYDSAITATVLSLERWIRELIHNRVPKNIAAEIDVSVVALTATEPDMRIVVTLPLWRATLKLSYPMVALYSSDTERLQKALAAKGDRLLMAIEEDYFPRAVQLRRAKRLGEMAEEISAWWSGSSISLKETVDALVKAGEELLARVGGPVDLEV